LRKGLIWVATSWARPDLAARFKCLFGRKCQLHTHTHLSLYVGTHGVLHDANLDRSNTFDGSPLILRSIAKSCAPSDFGWKVPTCNIELTIRNIQPSCCRSNSAPVQRRPIRLGRRAMARCAMTAVSPHRQPARKCHSGGRLQRNEPGSVSDPLEKGHLRRPNRPRDVRPRFIYRPSLSYGFHVRFSKAATLEKDQDSQTRSSLRAISESKLSALSTCLLSRSLSLSVSSSIRLSSLFHPLPSQWGLCHQKPCSASIWATRAPVAGSHGWA
jgi:hypothetical protein